MHVSDENLAGNVTFGETLCTFHDADSAGNVPFGEMLCTFHDYNFAENITFRQDSHRETCTKPLQQLLFWVKFSS